MDITETIAEVLRLDELSEDLSPAPWHMSGVDSQHVQDDAGEATADAYCSNDATLITYYRTAAPALAREVRRLQIILEACDERSQMCLEAEEEADAELRAALDEIDRLRACALPSEGAYISGRVDGERIGFRAGQEVMRERAAALCRARAEVNEQTVAEADEAEYLADAIRALEVSHD